MNKKSLRQSIREQRRKLEPYEQWHAAECMTSIAKSSGLLRRHKRIACYVASDGEIESWSIIEYLWSLNKKVYLPVISHLAWSPLKFAPFTPDSELVVNKFGIIEPYVRPEKKVSAQQLDLILMPLVAFDKSGNRLGMGQGYYDRSLKFLNHRKNWKRPALAGLAYDFQCTDKIKNEPWDIPVQYALTDKQLLKF